MDATRILTILLALSVALNIAQAAAAIARTGGASVPQAIFIGGGAACTALTVFFAGLGVYH